MVAQNQWQTASGGISPPAMSIGAGASMQGTNPLAIMIIQRRRSGRWPPPRSKYSMQRRMCKKIQWVSIKDKQADSPRAELLSPPSIIPSTFIMQRRRLWCGHHLVFYPLWSAKVRMGYVIFVICLQLVHPETVKSQKGGGGKKCERRAIQHYLGGPKDSWCSLPPLLLSLAYCYRSEAPRIFGGDVSCRGARRF